jgi:hypothetical protein
MSKVRNLTKPVILSEAQVTHIADMIYFGNDEESRALQLADFCCWTITQHLLGNSFVKPYYSLLQPQIVNGGAPLLYSGN